MHLTILITYGQNIKIEIEVLMTIKGQSFKNGKLIATYLALSFLIFSSHGIAPQNGA